MDDSKTGQQDPKAAVSRMAAAQAKPTYYANLIGAHGSAHDIKLSFGKQDSGAGQQFDVDVYLGYLTVKELVRMLGDMVTQYEATFGEVPTKPKASDK